MNQPALDFWKASPFDFWAIYEGYFGGPEESEPMTGDRLQEMIQRDRERKKENV